MSGLQMKYFVLKPAGNGPYAEASRAALRAYAKAIENENVELAHDLEMWRIDEQGKANESDLRRRLAADSEGQSAD